jgi:hypothetical protein
MHAPSNQTLDKTHTLMAQKLNDSCGRNSSGVVIAAYNHAEMQSSHQFYWHTKHMQMNSLAVHTVGHFALFWCRAGSTSCSINTNASRHQRIHVLQPSKVLRAFNRSDNSRKKALPVIKAHQAQKTITPHNAAAQCISQQAWNMWLLLLLSGLPRNCRIHAALAFFLCQFA